MQCRYDLLCIEGIARALRIYLGKDQATNYKIKLPPGGEDALLTATVDKEVCIQLDFLGDRAELMCI